MSSKRLAFTKMDFGLRKVAWLGGRHSEVMSRWIPRRPVLGVEMDGKSLLLACLKPGWGRAPVSYFGTISDFAALSTEELRAKLQEFLAPLSGEEPMVALGLPRRESMIRFLSLPAAARKSLSEAVSLQVEMYKPTDNELVDWDTVVIDEQQQLATTLVLVPRTTVEKLANLFSRAAYPITQITVTQFAELHLFLCAESVPQDKRFLLVDGRNQDVELALLEGRKLLYSRSLPLGRDGATAANELLAEIRQAFSSLRWKEEENLVVLVTGELPVPSEVALASLGLIERLQEKIRQQALHEQGGLQKYWGAAVVALSALTGRRQTYSLNLLPAELRPIRRHSRYLITYVLLFANAVLLLSLGLRVPLQNYVLLRQYRKEIAGVQVRAEEIKSLLEKERAMREELLELDRLQQHGRQPLDALNEIAQKLPPDAWLSIFSFRKGQIELSGSAKAASPLLPLFQSSPQFQDVKFNGALTEDAAGAEHFRLQMKLKEKP